MDLISRKKALERMMYSKPVIGEDKSKERYRYMQWLADYNALKEVPSVQPEQHWIPCSDMLPEKVFSEHANDFIYPTVIICDESGRVTAGFYGEYVDGGSYWYDMDLETEISNIVAWMPLPEPWRGEET